ncbi:hypothetical protein MVEN_00644600 [Mycena venus]|uniref:MYND-type domain-containing protein n=1 Tax=Mycena venus TaxID=2733690 RepID=A0A8H7D8S1_9AGAR|nr:hypothetical protein MVEN_00644600 [Mycena venus]
MHGAFRLDKLNRLPLSMRRAAVAACSPNRTIQDVRRVRISMTIATDEQKVLLLPVVYVNLDPTSIPDEESPDNDASHEDLIARTLLCLEILYVIEFPNDIGPEIWPRVWPWVRFYRDRLPRLQPQLWGTFCLEFLMFAGTFANHAETYALILSTPGVYFMVAKAWPSVFEITEPQKRELAFNDLRSFLVPKDVVAEDNLADLIEGSGGTLRDLAHLVVRYIDSVVPSPKRALHYTSIHFLSGILEFITLVDPKLSDAETMEEKASDFGIALLSQNFVGALTNAACALSASPGPDATLALHDTLKILGILLGGTPGYKRLPEALNRHLLRALVNCATFPDGARIDFVEVFFVAIFPMALVYYSVISALAPALDEVRELIKAPSFRASEMYEHWSAFFSLAEDRILVFNSYNNNENPSMRACDNMKCSEIGLKDKFKRCTGCHSIYYCSQACQAIDWRGGGHRRACKSYGTLYLSEDNDLRLKARDRAFLRALVHDDYLKSKPLVLPQKLAYMHEFPGEALLTLYDYTNGRVKVTVQRVGSDATKLRLHGSEWDDIVARAAASCGRMWVDVVVMPGSDTMRYWVIPLRTSTSTVYDGLRQLVSELTGDRRTWNSDLVADRLIPLVVSNEPDVVEVH